MWFSLKIYSTPAAAERTIEVDCKALVRLLSMSNFVLLHLEEKFNFYCCSGCCHGGLINFIKWPHNHFLSNKIQYLLRSHLSSVIWTKINAWIKVSSLSCWKNCTFILLTSAFNFGSQISLNSKKPSVYLLSTTEYGSIGTLLLHACQIIIVI